MAVNVSNEFHRTSTNPIDDSMVLTKAEMREYNDNLMPDKYFAVCKDDGCLYIYDKFATPTLDENTGTGKFVKLDSKQAVTFAEAQTRANIISNETLSTLFGKIKKWFTDLKTVAFSNSYNDLNDKPTLGTAASRNVGTANGVAELDEYGKVISTQLPSYVDDIIEMYYNPNDESFYLTREGEYPNYTYSDEITEGESGKIYVDLTEDKTYRWSGSAFVVISETLALGETESTAYRGDRGKVAYDHSLMTSGNPHHVTKGDIGLDNVVNTGDSAIPVENGATKFTTGGAYTELNKKVDKVDGMGLSTNDYTTAEKEKLTGIANGAEVNVQPDWNQADNTKDDYVKNKPTKLSDFTDDIVSGNYLPIHGNADSATTATTADTWTTARTLTIGATGKTFDGSADVSWTPTEVNRVLLGDTNIVGRIVIALCELSDTNTNVYSGWSGRIVAQRESTGDDYAQWADINITAKKQAAYGFEYTLVTSARNTNTTSVGAAAGFRMCRFQYTIDGTQKWYGGVEFYNSWGSRYFYADGFHLRYTFTPFIVRYATISDSTPVSVNDEIYNSIDFSTTYCVERNVAYTGTLNGSATKLGTANIGNSKIPFYLNAGVPTKCDIYRYHYDGSASWSSYPWHKVAYKVVSSVNSDYVLTLLVSRGDNATIGNGILRCRVRRDANDSGGNPVINATGTTAAWIINNGIDIDNFVLVWDSTNITIELWCKIPARYGGYHFTVLDSGSRWENNELYWTLCDSLNGNGSATYTQGDVVIKSINNPIDMPLGGRNLVRNSADMSLRDTSAGINGWRLSESGTLTHQDINDAPISLLKGAIRLTNSGSSSIRSGAAQDNLYVSLKNGDYITESFYIRASVEFTSAMQIQPFYKSSSIIASIGITKTITTNWQYVKATARVTADYTGTASLGYVYVNSIPSGAWYEVCGMKVEWGGMATDWTPAVEDIQTPYIVAADTRNNIANGDDLSTIFGKIKKWFTDLADLAFINKPSSGQTTTFLRGDGTWQTPYDSGTKTQLEEGLVETDEVWSPKILSSYIADMVASSNHFKGSFNASNGTINETTDTLTSVANAVGDSYTCSVAGTYATVAFNVGDSLIFKRAVNAGTAPTSSDFTAIHNNSSVTDNNPTLSWGTQSKVGTVSGVDLHVTMPSNPNTWRAIKVNGTQQFSTSTSGSAVDFVAGSNVTLTYSSSGAKITIAANDTTYSQGDGITIDASNNINCNLNSTTSLGTIGTTDKLYAVGVDSNGKLCALVDLSVGGRNLHKDSANIGSSWIKENATVSNGVATITRVTADARIYQMMPSANWTWEANTEYVASIEAKADVSGKKLAISPYGANVSDKNIELTTEWKRYYYAFKSGTNVTTGSMSYRAYDNNSTIYVRKPKLESGTIPTDWCPAIEDYADVAFSGSYTDLSDTPTSLPANGGTAENVSGVVAIANGGTNKTSWDKNKVVFASDTNVLGQMAHASTTNYLLKSGSSSAAPTWIPYTSGNTASAIVQRDGNGYISATSYMSINTKTNGVTASRFIFTDTPSTNTEYAAIFATYENYGGRIKFRQFSGSSTAKTSYYELYQLPQTNASRTGTATYNILTSKDLSFSITGNAATATTATTATKLGTNNVGSSTRPIYLSAGEPNACTYTLGKSVPSDAVFTDTTYTFQDGLSASGTTVSNSGVRSVAESTTNGSISVNTGGTTTNVAVHGLSDLAYIAKGSSGFLKYDGTWATPTNTKNTAGSTDTSSKIFIIGATSQAANPQTYSHDTAYVGTDGHLYSNSKQVVNLSDTQALTNKTYEGYTLGAACAKGVETSLTNTDNNIPTSAAVKSFVENKGYLTSISVATSSALGGIKIGFSESNSGSDTARNYAVKLSSQKAYVNVPWTDTKVTQEFSSTAGSVYYVLLNGTAGSTNTETSIVRKQNTFYYTAGGAGWTLREPLNSNSYITAGSVYQTSDDRKKNYIGDFSFDITKLSDIPLKEFEYKDDETKTRRIGTSAQSLEKILPELVRTDNEGYKSVEYSKLSIVALDCIKQLQDKIEMLEKRIVELEKR